MSAIQVSVQTLTIGEQFAIAIRNPAVGFSFVGRSLSLVLDHIASGTRLELTESGCTKTVGTTTTTLDTTPVVITDSNQRVSWTRSVTFTEANFPPGTWLGFFYYGVDSNSLAAYLRIDLTVELPALGAP
jgi:hypothetical protein